MSNPIRPIAPVSISVTPTNVAVAFGTTVQLEPVLTGSDGNPFTPTEPFTYSSSNDALLTVDSSGLCTAVTPDDPNVLNTGGIVEITVNYPYSNRTDSEFITAYSFIKVLATPATSIFSPTSPGVSGGDAASDFTYLQTHTGATPKGAGVRVVPIP
jgi:Bacterial Ig-like domain (group 2)